MKGLTLPIFQHTSDTRSLKNAGVAYEYADCSVAEMIFYHIDAIGPEEVYTCIQTNGSDFVCPLPPESVKELVSNAYKSGDLK